MGKTTRWIFRVVEKIVNLNKSLIILNINII